MTSIRKITGATLDPMAAYLLVRGLKTLALRIRQQNESALRIARWLEARPEVEVVNYPGLESDHLAAGFHLQRRRAHLRSGQAEGQLTGQGHLGPKRDMFVHRETITQKSRSQPRRPHPEHRTNRPV